MKIQRPNSNIQSFASGATGTERTVFGSTTQSDNLADNLNASFNRGWGILTAGTKPSIQDFNGAMYTLGQLSSYLYQMGISEWANAQEYHQGSIVNVGGILYRSRINNNTGNNPASSSVEWELVVKVYSVNGQTGDVTITAADLGAITQSDADNRYLQLVNAPDVVVLYPNGSEAAPATISVSQRIIIDNPFPGHQVVTIAEIFVNGGWGDPGFIYGSGSGSLGFGVKSAMFGSSIVIQSGSSGVTTDSSFTGNPFGNTGIVVSANFRVKVWRIK